MKGCVSVAEGPPNRGLVIRPGAGAFSAVVMRHPLPSGRWRELLADDPAEGPEGPEPPLRGECVPEPRQGDPRSWPRRGRGGTEGSGGRGMAVLPGMTHESCRTMRRDEATPRSRLPGIR